MHLFWLETKVASRARFLLTLVLVLAAFPVIGQSPRIPITTLGPPAAPLEVRRDRLLVKPRTEAEVSRLAVLHAANGCQVIRSFPRFGNLEVLALPAGASVTNLLATYQGSGLVAYAEPDVVVKALLLPNDFNLWNGDLWNLTNSGQYGGTPGADIHAPAAWDIQHTATNVVVAVVDTGARLTHEDLAANLWVNPGEIPNNGIDDEGDGYIDDVHGINVLLNNGDPTDDYGHGTHVSGIIGAVGNNTVGIVGVAWSVPLMECKFLDSTGNGTISGAIQCIDYALMWKAKIINASWGATNFTSQALYNAINTARTNGVIFVAACGNSGFNNDVTPIYPASYDLDNIVAVAATDRNDNLASWSDYGPTSVDLGAPGAPVFSCWNTSDSAYQYYQGTSMAAAHVSGACALVWAHFPNLTYRQVIQRILSTVDPEPTLAGKCVSGGRLNLYQALAAPAVAASFTATPTSGVAPLTVNFTDTSTGPVASRSWNFGDGTALSSQTNPSHTYSVAGDFTVTLTVVSSIDGSSSSANGTETVTTSSGVLQVSPATGFSSSGRMGGPFSPKSQAYTLGNTGTASLNWTAAVNANWLSLSATSGALTIGQQTTATVSLNGNARKLKSGTYSATVTFTNQTNGNGNTTRSVTLTVN